MNRQICKEDTALCLLRTLWFFGSWIERTCSMPHFPMGACVCARV
jgi:hypothetical protein